MIDLSMDENRGASFRMETICENQIHGNRPFRIKRSKTDNIDFSQQSARALFVISIVIPAAMKPVSIQPDGDWRRLRKGSQGTRTAAPSIRPCRRSSSARLASRKAS
ncbi:hypothetical protein ACTPOE_03200 [Castellaniella sp. WN]